MKEYSLKIVLLRHGQYAKEPSEKLTKLGVKQARLAGKKLKEISFDEIYVSTMPRALETAALVTKELGAVPKLQRCDLLQECIPGFPQKLRKKFKVTDDKKLRTDKKQADLAFKKYFKKGASEKSVLLVCHGNIIRYLICKALEIDTDVWTKMDILQCGFSIVQYNLQKKCFELISHNEIGHIKLKDRTFI